MDAADLIRDLRPLLGRALVATDFDGTLAPLVADPQDSRPVPGALDALRALTAQGVQVAVVTGRDAATVVRLGGLHSVAGLVVAGLYGLESWADGELTSPREPDEVHDLRARLPRVLEGADPDLWIEDKRLSLVVHARRAGDPDAALAALVGPVTTLAEELGFEVHPGAQVLELRLPGFDKAGALERLAAGRGAVLYLGDDLGDLPAFAQIARLRADGTPAWSVAVASSGVQRVAQAADVVVADPAAAARLLAELAAVGEASGQSASS